MAKFTGITLPVLLTLAWSAVASSSPSVVPNPALQYHIQTDQGAERFFRFQTLSGQFRKEHRNADGSVEGSYGWVDPNGVLRLFDYVSDSQGYRVEKQRQYKVGKPVGDNGRGFSLPTAGGDLNLGFEVFPLDANSDPAFNGVAAAAGGIPLGGASGFRAVNQPEGAFFGVTPSYQVASLTSTHNDPANPVTKLAGATFFEADPIIVRAHIPKPQPKPRIVIGKTSNAAAVVPTPRKKQPIVIGYSANNAEVRRPAGALATPISRPRSSPSSPSSSSNQPRRGIVIGRTARMLGLF